MKKFELPEQPKITNTAKDFTVAKEAISNLDKFDYAWKSYSHKLERRFTAAIKYIEEIERENQRLRAENIAVKTLVEDAKKQQPEIPEFVAEFIKKYKGNWSLFGAFRNISGNKVNNETLYRWVFAHAGRQELFAQAWINGYTVKEKRFYLKNKLTSLYLTLNMEANEYYEHHQYSAFKNQEGWKYKFTQQEIGSMEAGSYEQIGVEE